MPRRRDQDLLDRVGSRIRRARTDRGMSQQDLAVAVGIEPETISRTETGASAMSLASLARVAKALEVSLGDLLDADRALPEPETPPDELELLRLYRSLDRRGAELVLALAREVAGRWPTSKG
jgi:transcriptional regulator with XRE-family HTH domain